MSSLRKTKCDAQQPPKIIAEVGCNHKGRLEVAREMIQVAAVFCKVDYVKFQKRNVLELLSAEEYAAPHPIPHNAYGPTYGAHREALELDIEQHLRLKLECEKFSVGYASSVWERTSATQIASLRPDFLKVPSGTNQDFDLLEWICANFDGQIHVSLGMTTRWEEERLVELLASRRRLADTVLYACTSGYPVAFEDLALLEIERLREDYRSQVAAIGFSGHHLGIAADVAAQTLGAEWIERHFTLDRTWKGTDHAASLEPDGLRRLVRDTRAVAKALAHKTSELLAVEEPQRAKLKRTRCTRKAG
ncbi:MAG: N-acetylneuraminate synthase family protein [Polyangiaceae bacterium]|nr:N-acetylneuraminate synthase family protein [Polyangiaceae bacterium]